MIDFRLLRHFAYFLAVADELHFGNAAKRLGMSQPPLSQQIQVLERSLGVRLFERSRQGVALSREGAAILAPVHRFMEHAQRLQQAVIDARQGRTDIVTIAAINSAMFDVMPRLMRTAKRIYPQLSLSVMEARSDEALSAVQRGEADIAFARFDDRIASLEVRPIVYDHLVLVLPVDHPLTQRNRVGLAEPADENFVLFPRRSSPSFFDQITSACRGAGFLAACALRSPFGGFPHRLCRLRRRRRHGAKPGDALWRRRRGVPAAGRNYQRRQHRRGLEAVIVQGTGADHRGHRGRHRRRSGGHTPIAGSPVEIAAAQ